MDRQLSRVDRALYWWGHYVRGGMAVQGAYGTSQWADGKPRTSPVQPRRRTKTPKPILPPTQPKETRSARSKIPCLRIDTESEKIHKAVIKLPDHYKPTLICIYIRGMGFRDIADKFGSTPNKIWKMRRNILLSIQNQL